MTRNMPMWYSKHLPMFHEIGEHSRIEVTRVPPTANSPPCLKLSHKVTPAEGHTQQRMEFIRLSLPVHCRRTFLRSRCVRSDTRDNAHDASALQRQG